MLGSSKLFAFGYLLGCVYLFVVARVICFLLSPGLTSSSSSFSFFLVLLLILILMFLICLYADAKRSACAPKPKGANKARL